MNVVLILTKGAGTKATHGQHRNAAVLQAALMACGAEQLCPHGLIDLDQPSDEAVQQTLVPWLNALVTKLEAKGIVSEW